MGGEWRETTLGNVLNLKRGYDLPTQDRISGPHPIVSSSGITGRHRDAKVKGPGVVTGRYGTLGEVHYVTEDFWPLNTTLYVQDFKGNDPRFVSYFLRSLNFQSYSDKSSVPGLNRNHLHLESVRIPKDVREQCAIAEILGSLDDKIELNRRTSGTLEKLARAIFRAWFVDFEPVKAKAAGARSFPSMPQQAFDALPTRLTPSELGPIPEGWEVKAVSDAFDVNPTRSLRKGESAPYLEMKGMPTNGHAPEAWIERPFGSGMRFINGDTLVARITPCLENGKTAFVDFLADGEIAWGSTEYIVLRPKPPLPPIFAYCLARTGEFRDFAIQNMTGTSGRQRVTPTAMDHFRIALPCEEVAVAFGEAVHPMFDCIRARMNESRKLATLRDYLLPKLLSGEVRVGAAELFLEKTTS